MRKSWAIPLALLVAGTVSVVAVAAAADTNPKPVSLRLQAAGDAALAKGQSSAAIDAYEAAVAADPRNGRAYIGMAHGYEALGLPGKAVKFYREALALDPNDLGALEGQGKALVARGAMARANLNLVRIRTLCRSDCSAAKRLEIAMATPVKATASVEVPKPVAAKN